ncbi:hypothetical protein MTO96_040823 [Rhipicephalus appendiculatus]
MSGATTFVNKGDSIVSRFDLVCDRKYLYDLSSLAPIVGSALVAPLLGLASDHVGRKPVMLVCAMVQLLATIACSFSQTYTFFVFTRVLLFVAADVTFLNTFVLIHEVTGNAHRSTFTILDTCSTGHDSPSADARAVSPRAALDAGPGTPQSSVVSC